MSGEPHDASRESWLHGYPRVGGTVLIGTGVYCAGCGICGGIVSGVCADAEEEDTPDEMSLLPEWPFDPSTCPVCLIETPPGLVVDTLTERMLALEARRAQRTAVHGTCL